MYIDLAFKADEKKKKKAEGPKIGFQLHQRAYRARAKPSNEHTHNHNLIHHPKKKSKRKLTQR